MKDRGNYNLKNLLSIGILILLLAALQAPLWRPGNVPQYISVTAGSSVEITSGREMVRAGIRESRTAAPKLLNPHKLLIGGRASGATQLLIFYQHGPGNIYQVVVRDPAPASGGLMVQR
jgi:hypothetical protein